MKPSVTFVLITLFTLASATLIQAEPQFGGPGSRAYRFVFIKTFNPDLAVVQGRGFRNWDNQISSLQIEHCSYGLPRTGSGVRFCYENGFPEYAKNTYAGCLCTPSGAASCSAGWSVLCDTRCQIRRRRTPPRTGCEDY